jgi:peptidoglycan/xylan/chitin deacetylase (PgdA/CDA1 family)
MLTRLGDLIGDGRFPWNRATLPKLPQSKTESSRLFVALTLDVEQGGGSGGKGGVSKIKPFLNQVAKILRNRPATFFIQGSLVERLGNDLKPFFKNHELGVHGWTHDRLWGDPVWFLKEKPLEKGEKEQHLSLSFDSFAKAGLPKPKSFRATNLVVNQGTLQLLPKYGFTVDSSWESFRDFRQPFKVNGLWEIPVSSLPRPRPRLGVFRDYQVFNMANVERLPARIWQENLRQIILVQQVPHVVFMAHSWDFAPGKFQEILDFLNKSWHVEYLTMQELAKKL